MRKKKLKFWSICMTIVLTAGLIMPNQWYSSQKFSVQAAGETSTAQGIHVDYHSKEEIADYLKNQGITLESLLRKGTPTTTYEEEPGVTSPYKAGCMSKESKEYALKVFNSVRYIAGISEVEFSSEFEEEAQYAAMINAANDEMSHAPVQPEGMPESMYQIAYKGSSSSNLAWDSINSPFAYTIVHSWIWDSGERNADGVGHRRWMLNPNMEVTGFGQAESESGVSYRALFAMNYGNKEKNDKDGVVWPAQNTPIEYFDEDSVWSISLKDVYSVQDKIKVILTDLNSQKNWEFSTYSKTGLFGLGAKSSAREDFIYFRPEEVLSYQAGDSYKVEITGLSEPVSYTVNFFSLESMMGDSGEITSPEPAIPENVYMAQKPGRVNLKKVKALRRGRVKVTWNNVYGANEYQVQYSVRRSFAGKRTNTAYGKSTYLYLKKKKTYYVRVRAVKYGNSANNYRDVRGAWSIVKKVKTKR